MVYYYRFWEENDPEKTECEDCGVLATEVDEFHVHHKNGRQFQNNLENLVGLCSSCHRKRHEDMETVQTFEEWKQAFKDELIS